MIGPWLTVLTLLVAMNVAAGLAILAMGSTALVRCISGLVFFCNLKFSLVHSKMPSPLVGSRSQST